MFQSPSIKVHLLRGVAGFAFLAMALHYGPVWGWWTVLPAVAALLCLGGCLMCWIVGFAGTILNGESTSLCLDGTCPKGKSTAKT